MDVLPRSCTRTAVTALTVLLGLQAGGRIFAQSVVTQDFETWPITSAWGTYMHEGWTLSDGQVKPNRGGFGPPIGIGCGWLHDFDQTTNSWILAPYLTNGAGTVSFWVRRNTGTSVSNIWQVQHSGNASDWTTARLFNEMQDDWQEVSVDVDITEPVYVRIIKTGDSGINQYLGIDDLSIEDPPGLRLSGLEHDPTLPTIDHRVHVRVQVKQVQTISNVVLRTFYRPGDRGPFSPITMVHTGGSGYRTAVPIAAGIPGLVQYYVESTHDGGGPSPVFAPAAGSNAPAFYSTTNIYLTTSLRQLNPSSRRTPLIISEIMYNPPGDDGTNSLEYIEIFNTSPVEEKIGGFRLSGDVDYTFPENQVLDARSFVLVAGDPAAFAAAYGVAAAFGPFQGNLPNDAGRVRLRNHLDALLLQIEYENRMPWPIAADGAGHSLLLSRPDYGERFVQAWSAGRYVGGSPGTADPPTNTPLDHVRINEFLAHTDLPEVDFIELYNHSGQAVDVSGCTLSDQAATPKFVIPPGSVLPAAGHLVFSQTDLGFSLRAAGDEIYFMNSAGTRVLDALRFGAQENGVSTGRFPDGDALWHALSSATAGDANANAELSIRDIVINEIMFAPISGSPDDEYIELYNMGSNAIDVGYWRFVDGIDFTIPPGTTIGAGEYLVIARNASNLIAIHPQLSAGNTVGDFSGRLSNRGECITLARPDNPELPSHDLVVVDAVTYADGEDWGRWIDTGGSSLELIDPRSDNRLAMNWSGSDETAKAGWVTVDYTGPVDLGARNPSQLRVMILQGGECLLDDIEVETEGGPMHFSTDFESGLAGWLLVGNHTRSSLETTEAFSGTQSMHVRSSGRGNLGSWRDGSTVWPELYSNHVTVAISPQPVNGDTVHIRAKARWLAGWPHMVFSLRGHWLETSETLDIPGNLGTPGLQNSRYQANAGPAVSDVAHTPVLPAAGEDVVVSCRVHDPDTINDATLHYRIVPSASLSDVIMRDDGRQGDAVAGDGVYAGTIPGQATAKRVAFHITTSDPVAAGTRFPISAPAGAPDRECVVSFNQSLRSGVLGHYIMWMTDISLNRWLTIPGSNYSNEPIDITLVYGPYRAIYNAGARYGGQWRRYSTPLGHAAYIVEIPMSERFIGQRDIKIDLPGQNDTDSSRQQENYCHWIAREIDVPITQLRFIHVYANHIYRGILHDLQTPSLDFSTSWFDDEDPVVYKSIGWLPLEPFGIYQDGWGNYKQSIYRWFWRKRRPNVPNDDFSPIYKIAESLDTADDDIYTKRAEAVVDIRGWAAYIGIIRAINGWDHYGYNNPKNMYVYTPYRRPAYLYLYDMDYTLGGSAALFPGGNHPAPVRMFNHPAFARVLYAIGKQLVDGPMQPENANAFMDTWVSALNANGGAVSSPDAYKTYVAGAYGTLNNIVNPVASAFEITTNSGNDFSTVDPIVELTGKAPVEITAFTVNGIEQEVRFPGVNDWMLDIGLQAGTNSLTIEGYDWRGNVVTSDTITVTLSTTPPSQIDQIIITEIMYHPVLPASEYIEIYNTSTEHSFDLRGWRLSGVDFIFGGGALIGPGEYRVLAENKTSYQYSYGNVELALGDYPGNLDNGGETIRLQMPVGSNTWITIDQVHYDDEPPWPAGADGGGKSLQLIDINADNDHAGNWAAYDASVSNEWKYRVVTGDVMNLSPIALLDAKFHVFAHSPGDVLVDDIVLVVGTVAESGPNLLENGDFETALSGPWSANGNHAASIIETNESHGGSACLRVSSTGSGVPPNDSVIQSESLFGLGVQTMTLSYWYKETTSVDGLTVEMNLTDASCSHPVAPPLMPTEDNETPGEPSAVAGSLFTFPLLWINEVMPSNTMTIMDNHGDYDPWIELYNADSNAIDLASYRLSNDGLDPGLWAFPTGTTIAVDERLLIWGDGETGETDAGNLHAAFRLNSARGIVVLAREHFGEAVVVDYVSYDQVGADASYGTYPEGERHSRQLFPSPTPGAVNSQAATPIPVVINEWMPDNETTLLDLTDTRFDDWFELYNAGSNDVELGGHFLTDNLTQTNKFAIPGGTIIQSRGYLHVWADNDTEFNAPGSDLHVNFRLNNAGEEIGLYTPNGTLLNAVAFGPLANDQSEGCWPDGASVIYPMLPPTPGTTNSVYVMFRVDLEDTSNNVYRIEANDSLLGTNWFLIDIVTADTAVITFSDPDATAFPYRFYRLIEQTP